MSEELVGSSLNQTDTGARLEGDLTMVERADHGSTPGAGCGIVWCKNDTPSTLYYTDDAGTDFPAGGLVSAAEYVIPLTDCRVWDALITLLPGTAANDDMALVTGTPGTNAPTLQGVDFGGTTSDECCAVLFALPAEYAAGETITVRAHAGMLTTVSDGTATLDCVCYSDDGDGTVSADICATAATTINSLTLADIDFTITPTGLTAGTILQIKLAFAASDTGNLGAMIPTVTKLSVLCDIRA